MMAFLFLKTLQLFEQEHCTRTPDRFLAVPAAAKHCSHTWSATHLGRLKRQPLAGALCPLTVRHTHTPLMQLDPEQSMCWNLFEQPNHPTVPAVFLIPHETTVVFHIPLLPPVTLQQPVAASKAALESLWESRSNAAPQNQEIRLQLHWADPRYPLRLRRRDGTVIQSQKGSETKVHFRVLSQVATELMGKLLLTPQP